MHEATLDQARADAPTRPPPLGHFPLGPTEWRGDEHITADYTLLHVLLPAKNAVLSAQTCFVAPAVVRSLLHTDQESKVAEILWNYCNPDGQDTARFLFLPVSNGDPRFGGTQWSLLFVDRGHPRGPLAYHYDSFEGSAQSVVAGQLAAKLGAQFVEVPMARQSNGYDCGVAVLLAATWELAFRLASGQAPEGAPLQLVEVIVDPLALQVRLTIANDWLL